MNNRSVYYVQNSILDPARHHNGDLVVSDDDLLDEPDVLTSADNRAEIDINEITITANSVPNNAGAAAQALETALKTKEKNVNIDRFKLGPGEDDVGLRNANDLEQGACGGACSVPDESCGEAEGLDDLEAAQGCSSRLPKVTNVNVFEEEDESPKKVKKCNLDAVFQRNDLSGAERSTTNNLGIDHQRSAAVSPVNAERSDTREEENAERNEYEEDEITIAKMASYLDETQ